MVGDDGRLVIPTGCVHSSSIEPISASGSPIPVISQSNTAFTRSSTKAKLPGFASPCTSVIVGQRSG
jgi:hypothetical protein